MRRLRTLVGSLAICAVMFLGVGSTSTPADAGMLGEHFGVRGGLAFVAGGAALLTLGGVLGTRLRHVKE